MMTKFPELWTDRLVLREIVPSDADAIFRIFGNPEVMGLSGSDPLPDINAAKALIGYFASGRALPSPDIRWGIQLEDNSELIGTCGFFAWNPGWRKCMLGYELDVAWQRKGLMSEALAMILNWGFFEMSLHKVEAQVHPNNFPSIKILNSFGFVHEGTLREAAHWAGNVHDMAQFGLIWHELCRHDLSVDFNEKRTTRIR